MPLYQQYLLTLQLVWLGFVFAFGACVGSLINVLVYRLPRGIGVVTPPSRCPSCQTRLTWRENIPILGWLLLRGRCRSCKVNISPEYPLVELAVAVLFAVTFVLFYMVPPGWGGGLGAVAPEWVRNPVEQMVPTFVLLLVLLGSLVAVTLVDAKTFTIPLVLTWVPAMLAALVHPLQALWLAQAGHVSGVTGGLRQAAEGYLWTIPTPGRENWGLILGALGGVLGLAVSNLLLAGGLIRRSFADYEAWEARVRAEMAAEQAGTAPPTAGTIEGATSLAEGQTAVGGAPEPASAAADTDSAPASARDPAPARAPASDPALAAAGAAVSASAETVPPAAPSMADQMPASPAELWIQYPHARREMLYEAAFLGPCAGLACAGWWIGEHSGLVGGGGGAGLAPLWLTVLGGVAMGFLIGGGVVWAVRILGSLAFGKEAIGLGDVHLMAAVGACLGWIDATAAFFAAAFVGLGWAVLSRLPALLRKESGESFQRPMPYGPFLAIATMLVIFFKPVVEWLLGRMLQSAVDIP